MPDFTLYRAWCRRKRKKCKGRAENAPKNPCVTRKECNGKTACVAKDVDLSFLSTEITGGFTGCTVGMYASANGTASTNHAAFYWFAYQQVRNKLR